MIKPSVSLKHTLKSNPNDIRVCYKVKKDVEMNKLKMNIHVQSQNMVETLDVTMVLMLVIFDYVHIKEFNSTESSTNIALFA